MKSLQLLFGLLIMAAVAYLFLRLFSRLFGVDVLAVMSWQIKKKQFLWIGGWALLFLLGFFPLLTLLEKPFTAVTMNMTHEGAMLGYAMDDEQAMLYDPAQREYRAYRIYPPPRAASSFDEAFETVAFYRPFLTDSLQNIELQGYFVSVMMLIIAGIMFGILPVLTYKMVQEYPREPGVPILSLQIVLDNCKAWTGFSLPAILTAAALFVVMMIILSGYLVNRIKAGYDEKFATTRQEFRSELMARVAPGKVLKGSVINRMRDVQTYSEGQSHTRGLRNASRDTKVIKYSVYTIEFGKLLSFEPVYLRLTLTGDAQSNRNIKRLDELFVSDESPESGGVLSRLEPRDARDPRELDFVVNDDYSVSLVPEER